MHWAAAGLAGGQLQGWVEHSCSSQAGGEALYADVVMQGKYPWVSRSDGSLCELMWFQSHVAVDKLACCEEELLPLELRAAPALRLCSPRGCGCMASSCQAVRLQDVLCSARQGPSQTSCG